MSLHALLEAARTLARDAGDAILSVYRRDFAVDYKDDRSPLTEADLAAHRLLVAGLSKLSPSFPVLSEESAEAVPAAERRAWSRYWLVDPLDGTREFVKRNDEFTVNIALIDETGDAIAGIVYAPALDELASAAKGEGAWLDTGEGRTALRVRAVPPVPVLAVSRSHADAATRDLLDRIGAHETLAAGSALKFIRVAQGRADLYPRFGPTSEWDTAGGQCVLEEAGGCVVDLAGRPLRYNRRETLLNGSFMAFGDSSTGWRKRIADALAATRSP